jgi:homopolymeric O-antigen transport system permease protein
MSENGFTWTLPPSLAQRRDLLRELVVRDMKLRYKRSYLGIAWTLVNPLMQLLVYTFVFHVLFRVNTPYYTSNVFVGIIAWAWFQAAVLESTVSILANRDLIRQPGFPAALLPNVTVGTHLLHFLLAFPILFGLAVVSGIPITGALVWLPLVILVQYVLTLSFSLLAACVHVNFRDTQYLLGVFLMLGFFLTPILYDVSMVPERYRTLYQLNPMTHLVGAYRAVLIRGWRPDLVSLGVVAVVSLVLLRLFYLLFRRASATFAEEF